MSCNVTIVARLVRDPELRFVPSGTGLAKGTVVYDVGWGDNKHPVFIDFTCWGKRGEALEKHFRKGSGIILHGEIDQETWDDKNTGAKRSRHVLNARDWAFPPKPPEDNYDNGGEPARPQKDYASSNAGAGTADFLDDNPDEGAPF